MQHLGGYLGNIFLLSYKLIKYFIYSFSLISFYGANLGASLTVTNFEKPIESLNDLSNQFKIAYSTVKNTYTMDYFQKMATIEKQFFKIWKDMSLNVSLSKLDRAKFAVWDYPLSNKYTKIWKSMQDTGFPPTIEDAVQRIRNSTSYAGKIVFLFTKKFYEISTSFHFPQ